MAPAGPVGHEELARMPYLEACFRVAALAGPHMQARSSAAVLAAQEVSVAASACNQGGVLLC